MLVFSKPWLMKAQGVLACPLARVRGPSQAENHGSECVLIYLSPVWGLFDFQVHDYPKNSRDVFCD